MIQNPNSIFASEYVVKNDQPIESEQSQQWRHDGNLLSGVPTVFTTILRKWETRETVTYLLSVVQEISSPVYSPSGDHRRYN